MAEDRITDAEESLFRPFNTFVDQLMELEDVKRELARSLSTVNILSESPESYDLATVG